MLYLYYDDNGTPTKVAEITTNHRMSIEDVLTLTGADMDTWADARHYDGWDYNRLYLTDNADGRDADAQSPYMVDVAKAVMKNGEVVEYREAHSIEYATLDEAESAYDKYVQHWQAQPDKPVCVTLSERDGDMWDGIKKEVIQ